MKIEKAVICHSIYFDCYSHSFLNGLLQPVLKARFLGAGYC